jgi:hypothetical protein
MMRSHRILYSIFVAGVALFLVGLEPMQFPDVASRDAAFRFGTVAGLVSSGVIVFAIDRGEFPASVDDLCAGPYLPVRCDALKNPYTGRRLSGASTPGEIEFARDGVKLRLIFHIQAGKDITMSHANPNRFLYCAAPESDQALARCPPLEEYRALDAASKRAYAVGNYLAGRLISLLAIEREMLAGKKVMPPESLAAFRSKMASYRDQWLRDGRVFGKMASTGWALGAKWVDWENLVNEFTSGQAIEVDTPSPGNFRYYRDGDKDQWILEAYGANGKVVYRQEIY